MNFSQMGEMAAFLLNQSPSVSNFYTSANLSSVINVAVLDVCKDLCPIEDSGDVTTTSSLYLYPLSASYMTGSNHLSIRAVFWNGNKLRQAGDEDVCWQFGETRPTATPRKYRINNAQIELDVYPEEAKTLQVNFYAKPAALANNTDDTEMGTEYDMAVIYKACYLLTLKDNEVARENNFFQQYLNETLTLKKLKIGHDSYAIPLDPRIISARRHGYYE